MGGGRAITDDGAPPEKKRTRQQMQEARQRPRQPVAPKATRCKGGGSWQRKGSEV